MLVKPAEWLHARLHPWFGLSADMPAAVPLLMLACCVLHFTFASRRCYDSAWWLALLQGHAAFIALGLASLFVYRPVQFLLSLWTM